MQLQRTLLLIKPNTFVDGHVGEVISRYEREGLRIIALKMGRFSREKMEGFFIHLQDRPFFSQIISYLSSYPIMILVFEGEDAVIKGRNIIGHANPEEALPNTIRKLYSRSTLENSVHGSKTHIEAEREIAYFFTSEEILSF